MLGLSSAGRHFQADRYFFRIGHAAAEILIGPGFIHSRVGLPRWKNARLSVWPEMLPIALLNELCGLVLGRWKLLERGSMRVGTLSQVIHSQESGLLRLIQGAIGRVSGVRGRHTDLGKGHSLQSLWGVGSRGA